MCYLVLIVKPRPLHLVTAAVHASDTVTAAQRLHHADEDVINLLNYTWMKALAKYVKICRQTKQC